MRSRLLHALLTLAAVFAAAFVWLAPARAWAGPTSRAPLCDPRGAITFAPPPQAQDVEVSLDTGLTLEDCLGGVDHTRADGHRAAPGRAPVPHDGWGASSDAVAFAAAALLAGCPCERLPAPGASTACARPGHTSQVDRPPRA